jgi:hypothetical protein
LRFLAPDPVVVPGQPAYVAMNADTVNFVDPDGRMLAGDWQTLVRSREQRAAQRALGLAMTFAMGPVYMAGLHYSSVMGPAAIHPVMLGLGAAYLAYLSYYAVNTWRRDRLARQQAAALMGTIVVIYQGTRSDVTLQDRARLLVTHDIPAAFAQVVTAQGGPDFATVWIGHASYGPFKRVLVYMSAYATNSYAEVFGQGLVVHLQSLNDIRPDRNMTFDTQMALGSTNMLVGNFCYYTCLAYHDVQGHWDSNMRMVQCKNIWMTCRAVGRLVSGTVSSQKNSTYDRMSDGAFNAAVGYSIDRVIGEQILANLPLRDVHGLFFPGDLPDMGMTEEEWGDLVDMGGFPLEGVENAIQWAPGHQAP